MLKHIQICFALLPLIIVGAAAAERAEVKACFELKSNAEQRDCAQHVYRSVSAKLEQVFQNELARAAMPPGDGIKFGAVNPAKRVEAMNKSQSAWQAYRDAECWGVVGSGGGTGTPTWAYVCLIEKSLQRIEELTVPIEKGR